MSKLIRNYRPGDICFITSTTFKRNPLLVANFDILLRAFKTTRNRIDFQLLAWVVLPDHIHALINCPNADYSKLLQSFKKSSSLQLRKKLNLSGPFWQRRFWDHVIRDEVDLRHHLDYIHFNHVKHRMVTDANCWLMSSLCRFKKLSLYEGGWGESVTFPEEQSYGE